MNKRRQSRKEVSHLVVEASDGNVLYSGIVSNLSYSGLVLDNVPPEINHRGEILSLTMYSKGKSYRLRALTRWVCGNDQRMTIGLRIFSVPRDWFKFVDGF